MGGRGLKAGRTATKIESVNHLKWTSLILFLFSTFLHAEETISVEQLIIVYSSRNDWNGIHLSLGQTLEPIFQAAKKRGLRVVLVNDDQISKPFESVDALKEFKSSLSNIIGSRNSWVILATHGSNTTSDLKSVV